MPRALLLLALTTTLAITHAAEVFVIADTANQTRTITEAAKETIAEANNIALHLDNDTLANPEDDHEPVVRKKRTFGDVVFRGLADVLGYNVARKPPQVVFPPPLAPVPGIDTPLQAVAFVPVVAAPVAPQPQAGAPAPCGRAVPPCAPPPPPPPPPKPTQPPCPRPRANPKPRPKPRPRPPKPPPPPPPPPPCARPRANPTTAAPCTPAAPPPAPAKADSNLETISSNFRLDFNFNRAPASAAPAVAANAAAEEQETEQEQEQIAPVAIQPRAAKLPQDPPRKPRVYLDAFVVRNGVAQRVHTVDAQALNRPQADDDYLVYDDEQPQQDHDDDDYEYVQESRDRAKAIKEFGTAVDRFWEQKQKPKRLPANDYRNVHFGDRNLANQIIQANEGKIQSLQKKRPKANSIPLPLPKEEEEYEDEITTTTQDPRKPLKPRVLPPTEHNPNQIDTVTVRVPPIYKEKRPKKLHRGRTERPDRDEDEEETVEPSEEPQENYDSDTENSSPIEQTEPPRRKRRRKNKRRVRSVSKEAYSAGDYDYYGKKIPISKEEEFFRGLTIPPPTKDADLARLEEGEADAHFLDDHERLREDPEKIKTYNRKRKNEDDSDDEERGDESERSDSKERSVDDREREGETERADETERSDRLSPNAQVRETGYQNQYVHASNVQVDDPNPLVTTVKRKSSKIHKP